MKHGSTYYKLHMRYAYVASALQNAGMFYESCIAYAFAIQYELIQQEQQQQDEEEYKGVESSLWEENDSTDCTKAQYVNTTAYRDVETEEILLNAEYYIASANDGGGGSGNKKSTVPLTARLVRIYVKHILKSRKRDTTHCCEDD
eukprot:5307283-Ditylum_brightwellii.AAC.1